jgi:CheY-like chemotaxis protein
MRRYLLVDDNAAFIDNLAEILRDGGSEVWVAETGVEALKLICGIRFDALVTDMRMPGMNGAELIHEARHVDAALPAIVVSAQSGRSELLAAQRQGLLAVLTKPVPIARLRGLLERARRGGVVALVEDDAALAENLTEVLRTSGFSAVTARSAAETAQLAGARPFAALTDLRVPQAAEGEALHPQPALLPLLVVTAYASERPLPAGLPVFEMPFDTVALLAAIEQLYKQHCQQGVT